MEPFKTLHGLVAPLDLPNVDTDQIIPKQFLKRIERTGFGPSLFYDWRFIQGEDGETLNPHFEMNAPRYWGATLLLTRANFGCGSSREHACWALLDYGIRCILAPSFADIFYNNCVHNGILPVLLAAQEVETLFQAVRAQEGFSLTVDLYTQQVRSESTCFSFPIRPHLRDRLLHGWDEITQTLQQEDKISEYERQRLLQGF